MVTVIRLSKWSSRGFSGSSHCGHLLADVLLLVLGHQPIADVADVDLPPVELVGPGLEIRLDVVQQLLDVDFVGGEVDLLAVAEAKSTVAPRPAGCVITGSKRPQLPTIWSSRAARYGMPFSLGRRRDTPSARRQ